MPNLTPAHIEPACPVASPLVVRSRTRAKESYRKPNKQTDRQTDKAVGGRVKIAKKS
jgi:hypothetical protein